jgi:hypothetical protein
MDSEEYPPEYPPNWISSGSLTESYTPWNGEGTQYYIEYGTPDYIECQWIPSAWASDHNESFFVTLNGDTAPFQSINQVSIMNVDSGIVYGSEWYGPNWIYMTDPNEPGCIISLIDIPWIDNGGIPPSGTYKVVISYSNGRPTDTSVWTFGLNSNEWWNPS